VGWRIEGITAILFKGRATEQLARRGMGTAEVRTLRRGSSDMSQLEQRESDGSVRKPMRIAAVGDLHVTKESGGQLRPYFSQLEGRADVLLLCGDLTDYGLADEAVVLAKELSAVKMPILAVLGNHDFESGHPEVVTHILAEAGVHVLDGGSHVVDGLGFAGIKGFAGGFGRGTLGPWGEPTIKGFVKEALDEALKLESALARLRVDRRVAMLHYAPIRATVEGEPEEIFPFLGCSRLEEPLERYPVTIAFHGHAHRGSLEGRTRVGTPVYNVAMPLLRRQLSAELPIRIVDLP
jgi:Icc-related predicted phosphoesterase